jgi:hypothetical protein
MDILATGSRIGYAISSGYLPINTTGFGTNCLFFTTNGALTTNRPAYPVDAWRIGCVVIAGAEGKILVNITPTKRWEELDGRFAAATNVDIFAVPSGNSAILQISAWSTNTARTDLLTRSSGVWVQASNTSRRYLGTIRTSATATGSDTEARRYVWNVSNQLPKILRRQDSTATWTYGLGTWRRLNNSSANRVQVVAGIAENTVDVQVLGIASNNAQIAIGVNSETVPVTSFGYGQADGAQSTSIGSRIQAQLTPGYNFLQALERSQPGSTSTFLGPTIALSGRWLC